MERYLSGASLAVRGPNSSELPGEADAGGRDFVYGLEGQEVLEETAARASGSKDSPCRAFHPLTFPEPHHGALGSQDFPLKQEDTATVGTDVMGPWVRVGVNEVLHLSQQIVHMNLPAQSSVELHTA